MQPQPRVTYTPPSTPQQEKPQKPPEPYYVPPTTQEPTFQPQPSITYTPAPPTPEKPEPPQQRPEKVYYTPPPHLQEALQQGAPAPQAAKPKFQQPAQTPPPPRPLTARPVSNATENNTPWGTLNFGDGTQVQLSGERALVGRYDHDLGGLQPEVDLGKMEGADTVSRIHAAIEHIGSTYTLTDLNSTNATRINNKRLEPDNATPINDGDTLSFGKVTATFNKA
jgi:hypothetical protein